VRGHLALARLAHAVALLGVGQDHRGLALVRAGGRVGGVDLHQVVAAALEAVDLLVRHTLGQRGQFGVLAEEVVAVEAPVLGGEGLHLAIHRAFERAHQRAR
jgi:O-acetyl-ADP-ribose deacetylase (regulator of RNase III)